MMGIPLTWKAVVLAALAVIGGAYLFSGPGDGTYTPPEPALEAEPAAQFNRAKFAQDLKAVAAGRLINRIEKGLSDYEVRLTINPAWHDLDQGARLRAAKEMWKAWSGMHAEKLRYKARIVIVDARGSKVGGSRLLNPADIWVRKP